MLIDEHGVIPSHAPRREVVCGDAFAFLEARTPFAGVSFVTSLPDVSELAPMGLDAWKAWFSEAARQVVLACPEDGAALFYQSDVIVDGQWIDKAHLVMRGAEATGARLLFHRIICRAAPGTAQFGRPAYAHLLGFSRGVNVRRERPRTDVLPSTGEMLWSKGMGVDACLDAVRFVLDHTSSRCIVDPFCGLGTVLAVANALGLDAVGVERVARRAQRARNLRIAATGSYAGRRRAEDGGSG